MTLKLIQSEQACANPFRVTTQKHHIVVFYDENQNLKFNSNGPALTHKGVRSKFCAHICTNMHIKAPCNENLLAMYRDESTQTYAIHLQLTNGILPIHCNFTNMKYTDTSSDEIAFAYTNTNGKNGNERVDWLPVDHMTHVAGIELLGFIESKFRPWCDTRILKAVVKSRSV